MTFQLELFLRLAVGLVGWPLVVGLGGALLWWLIGAEVQAEVEETETDNVQVAAYLDHSDIYTRYRQ
jgi:hypothetical protein